MFRHDGHQYVGHHAATIPFLSFPRPACFSSVCHPDIVAAIDSFILLSPAWDNLLPSSARDRQTIALTAKRFGLHFFRPIVLSSGEARGPPAMPTPARAWFGREHTSGYPSQIPTSPVSGQGRGLSGNPAETVSWLATDTVGLPACSTPLPYLSGRVPAVWP